MGRNGFKKISGSVIKYIEYAKYCGCLTSLCPRLVESVGCDPAGDVPREILPKNPMIEATQNPDRPKLITINPSGVMGFVLSRNVKTLVDILSLIIIPQKSRVVTINTARYLAGVSDSEYSLIDVLDFLKTM